MSEVALTEKLLAGLAGWEVIKQARAIIAENRVLSSHWQPPVLRGVVQSGSTSYRAGLVIRRENDAENLCTCRQSRDWGTLCAHSVAVGIHAIKAAAPPEGTPARPAPGARPQATPAPARSAVRRLRRAAEGESGESLEIHVILPPNLGEGLSRGRGSFFLEGRSRKGQVPLQALPVDQPFSLSSEDLRLLDAAELLAGGDTPSMLQVASTDFVTLFAAMAGHPRVTFGKNQRVQVSPEPWRIPLRATLADSGEITLELRPGGPPPFIAPGQPAWVIAGIEIRPLGLPPECLPVLQGPMRWNRAQVPLFVSVVWPQLCRVADLKANFAETDFELSPQRPKFHLELAGGLASLTACLQCVYGHRVLTLGTASKDEAIWMPDPQNPRRYSTRDFSAEREAVTRLTRSGFTGPDPQGRYQLSGQDRVLAFFAREFSRIEKEWQVSLEERLQRSTEKNLDRIEPHFAVTSSGEQWFDLQVTFSSRAGERLTTSDVQRLLRGGAGARLRNGKFAILDTGAVEELQEVLADCAPQQQDGGYRIGQAQAGFLTTTLQQNGWDAVAPSTWRERARQQAGLIELECPPLGELDAILRPYQKQGVAWLQFLRRHGFGGILADEMGLGKTLQTLAHLMATGSACAAADRDALSAPPKVLSLPHLVICPTSLVSNWVSEARRFTPHLRVLALHGPGRHDLFAQVPSHDLVITSYALVRRDLDRHRALEYDTVILDEAQHIKNRQTQNAQAVKSIRSRHRLVLTGTPLENSVLDLWSVFDFLMPGYLGAAQDFRDRYEVPIVREKNEAAQARLSRRVRPFLMRRLKRDVAPELPPRIDQVVWCELTGEQAAVYQQLLLATQRQVADAVGAQGLAKSRMLVLTALLRLRQVCCDLRLLGLEENPPATETPAEPRGEGASNGKADASGKVEAFNELVEEVLDGGHRVLVFSQFTSMLRLLREQLEKDGIRYTYLDGSTTDRGAVVEAFQASPDIPVFLISLKAGGVGLNLTAADTVIHFDPWWNPAVEDQATDRAHRIGQSRVVTSYKLITRGTVEEKILALQQRKRDVIRSLLAGEEQLAGGLTWEEISELLS